MATQLKTLFLIAITLFSLKGIAGSNEDLILACKAGDLEGVKKAINAAADVNALDAAGNPAITSAFFWPDIVKYLLDHKADPNLGNTTILFQASMYNSPDVVKLVLEAGADPNKACKSEAAAGLVKMIAEEKKKGRAADKASIKVWEMTIKMLPPDIYVLPSMLAGGNCVSCLQQLLDKGANAERPTTEGTLLHTFASSGASAEYRKTVIPSIKKVLEQYGYKVPDWYSNMPEDRNGTAEQMLKPLLSKGLKINEKNKGLNGIPPQTPLEIALGGGLGNKEEVMLALIANGADVNIESDWYGRAILQAAQTGYAAVLKAMIEKGADINEEGKCFTDAANSAQIKSFTPLTAAACKNHLEAVKFLTEKGAKTDGIHGNIVGGCVGNLKNKSAIYFAIEHKNMEMVKFIAEHHGFNGKNISVSAKRMTNCVGGGTYSPSEYASELGATEIASYLKQQGL